MRMNIHQKKMVKKMIELRNILQTQLKTICSNVYFQSATQTANFPYIVFEIINVRSDGEYFEQAVIDVDGWSNNKDTTELEYMMKEVEVILNHKTFTSGNKTATFFLETKMPVSDTQFQRRKYTFQVRIF